MDYAGLATLASSIAGEPVSIRTEECARERNAWAYAQIDESGKRWIVLDRRLPAEMMDYVILHESGHFRLRQVAQTGSSRRGKSLPAPHYCVTPSDREVCARIERKVNKWVLDHAHDYFDGERLAAVRQYAMDAAVSAGISEVAAMVDGLGERVARLER